MIRIDYIDSKGKKKVKWLENMELANAYIHVLSKNGIILQVKDCPNVIDIH